LLLCLQFYPHLILEKSENWKTGKLGKLENWKTGKLENLENWKTWKTGKWKNRKEKMDKKKAWSLKAPRLFSLSLFFL